MTGCEEWVATQELTRTRLLDSLGPGDSGRAISERLKQYLSKFMGSSGVQVDGAFHRLCGRVVLAVVETSDGELFEGINTEVSIVTGSICGERAAFVHARSRRPELRMQDLVAVACITIPLVSENGLDRNPLWPCGVCMEWVQKIQAKNPHFRMFAYDSVRMEKLVERRTAASAFPAGVRGSGSDVASPSMRGRMGSIRASYRKILEVFTAGEPLSSREVKKRLPWVRKWWIRDLQERGFLDEKDEHFSINSAGLALLADESSHTPSSSNRHSCNATWQ
jgi:cytidine deaminase